MSYVSDLSFNTKTETMDDEVNDPRRKDWKRKLQRRIDIANQILDPVLRNSVKSDFYTASVECHKCTHVKVDLDINDVAMTSQHATLPHMSFTHTYQGGYAFHQFLGMSLSAGDKNRILTYWSTAARAYTAEGYHTPDWFALLDRWHESCNNLLPSASLIGESIVENAIFVDAFKAILNPSSALKTFLQFALKYRKHKAFKKKMGQVARTSADAFLGYNFGIAPAIDELRNIFLAHKRVSKRLKFLRDNAGGYVPVRARGVIPCDYTNSDSFTSPRVLCVSKGSEATISCLAKVRTDLDFAQDWKAYMQYFGLHKFIGLAWELIPLSFVLDWVTNAGDYVSKYTTPHFASPFYNMRNLCHSLKNYVVEKYVVPKDYYFNEYASRLTSEATIAYGTTASYERNRGLPSTSGNVDFSLLGTFHGLASSALLIQKLTGGSLKS
jgi:hypothetical protein